MSSRRSSWLLLAVLVLPGTAAAAPGDGRDPAAAESLFQRGVELLKKNDWVEACKAFDASMKLDPSVGTQINIARCALNDGRIASAWADFRKAKALNAETPLAKRKANVDGFVDAELKKLEPRLPWLTLKLSIKPLAGGVAPAPSAVSGLVIERDGLKLPAESVGVEVPIDPGKHKFTVSAPGYRTSTVEHKFEEGKKHAVTLELVEEPKAAVPPAAGPTKLPTAPPPEPEMSPMLPAGIALASVGAAGLIVSAVTGGLAFSDHSQVKTLVDSGQCSGSGDRISCPPALQQQAEDAIDRGETLSLVSTVSLFAGAAVAATGVVLIAVGATASDEAPANNAPVVAWSFAPWLSSHAVGLTLGGSLR